MFGLNRLWIYGGAGLIGLALVSALVFFIRADAAKTEQIVQMREQLSDAYARVAFVERQWAESSAREGVTQAEAARICAAEGSSAFDRGVAFGRASCGL